VSARGKGEVRLDRVVISYGKEPVVHGISLVIAPGEFVCLLGPSGCGKTTTLRSIAGLAAIDGGTIAIDGEVANLLPAHRRGIGMVFQDLALFPHMSVRDNVGFGLALRKIDAATSASRIREILALLHLSGFEDRLPRQLSGGQQQRVALARSLVVNPSVLLLDEPFAALDRKLREEMRREIRALQRALGITTVFVTHDQEEALTMSDRVVVMNGGRIEQIGTPDEVYEAPANRFVLDFVGFSNFLRVEAISGADRDRGTIAGTAVRLPPHAIEGKASDAIAELAIRPERIRLLRDDTVRDAANALTGRILDIAYEGALLTYDVALADGQRVFVREANAGRGAIGQHRIDQPVALRWQPEDAVLVL